jgi:hypothetical protein
MHEGPCCTSILPLPRQSRRARRLLRKGGGNGVRQRPRASIVHLPMTTVSVTQILIAVGSNVETRALKFQTRLNFERGILPSHLASKLNPHFDRQPAATNPHDGSNSYPFILILSFGSQRIALSSTSKMSKFNI